MLDGLVVSAPGLNDGPILGGQAQITGNFSQAEATSLANVLKFGALPLTFDAGEVQEVSATLGGDQLTGRADRRHHRAGPGRPLLAALLPRRSAWSPWPACWSPRSLTYGLVVLLGWQIGFRLSLAGIAGLIVAIGITADSFIVYFERIRDEVRDGKTLRVAVETGWDARPAHDPGRRLRVVPRGRRALRPVRRRRARLRVHPRPDDADRHRRRVPVHQAAGDPLARTKFFGQGHKLSGLDPDRLGGRRADDPDATRRRGAAAGTATSTAKEA